MGLHHYEPNEITALLSGILYVHNGAGSLVSDAGRGIARIDYDMNNNPVRIQFTDGSVTRYVYSAAGEKLRVTHQTAVPNITVAIGCTRELSRSEILSTDSTEFLLGGRLTMKNGRIDKFLFDEGYCQAERYAYDYSQDNFIFYYYDRDHLGSIRQVVKAAGSQATVFQKMNYYPFGAQWCDGSTDNNFQPYRYNGKELDKMHGLNTYDYGARQYNPVTARWDRMDPLCEKYYGVSPYAYCKGNPIKFIDIKGYKPGDFFTSMDMAALDFGLIYNNNSIIDNREYSSSIFIVYKDGKKGYTYTVPSKGKMGYSNASLPPLGIKPIAWIHTHGAAIDENGESHNYNRFTGHEFDMTSEELKAISEIRPKTADIAIANNSNQTAYLASPNGCLQKYDPSTGEVITISTDLPSDNRDSERLNNNDYIPNKHNQANNRLLYNINVFFKALGTRAFSNFYK